MKVYFIEVWDNNPHTIKRTIKVSSEEQLFKKMNEYGRNSYLAVYGYSGCILDWS